VIPGNAALVLKLNGAILLRHTVRPNLDLWLHARSAKKATMTINGIAATAATTTPADSILLLLLTLLLPLYAS
jgi:hypothetical protein